MDSVFISYKSQDAYEARCVKEALESNGLGCWMAPTSIPGGSSYAREISKAIKECKVLVLIMSEHTQESKWIPKELDMAINEEKTILPFFVEACTLGDEFSFYLTNVQQYFAYEDKEKALMKMGQRIFEIVGIQREFTLIYADTPKNSKQNNEGVKIDYSAAKGRTEKVGVPPNEHKAGQSGGQKQSTARAKPKQKFEIMCVVSLVLAILSVGKIQVILIFQIASILLAIFGAERCNKLDMKGKTAAGFGLGISLLSLADLIFVFFGSGFGSITVIAVICFVSIYFFAKKAKKKR